MANLHRGEILSETDLPKYYCAYSPCFRAEAGAAGVATRGMIRVHQFDKVELIKVVKPEDGYDELEKMLINAETVLQQLGLHYRVLALSSGDMGFAAAKTYDIEVWAPGQGGYLEVSSVSNTEDFQARHRMKTRFKAEQGGNQLPHILNGSGVALARLFVALIETHQQNDGSIKIPEPLQPYLRTDTIPAASAMRILQATSEFFPYSKTGGLADMVAGLSGALAELSEDVTVATPLYRGIREQVPDLKPFGPKVILPLGKQTFTGRWWKATESNGLTLLFLEQEGFYDRPGLYMANGDGYWDNPERFMFLSKAVAQLAGEYDVVHVHDWQTAFVPMLLRASALE